MDEFSICYRERVKEKEKEKEKESWCCVAWVFASRSLDARGSLESKNSSISTFCEAFPFIMIGKLTWIAEYSHITLLLYINFEPMLIFHLRQFLLPSLQPPPFFFSSV